jgi:formate hydrogenlyase transcriptional activator
MREYENIAGLKTQLERENAYLREELAAQHQFDDILSTGMGLASVGESIRQAAASDEPVLIVGEVGTGKELIARAIHARSARHERLLVKADCAAPSARLIERNLFGGVLDASADVVVNSPGRFELADGGTIFLDEIAELPLQTQVALLRVLENKQIEPTGSSGRTVNVDVRVIAATNRNLEHEVALGRFRADLYVNLNAIPIRVPALRERRGDIAPLVSLFIERHAKRIGRTIDGVDVESMERLTRYAWPGNVRELEHVIVRALILSAGGLLDVGHDLIEATSTEAMPDASREPAVHSYVGSGTLEDVERAHILAVLAQTGWVIEGPRGAAKILDLHPNTLRSRMKKLGVERARHGVVAPPPVEGV